MINTTKLNQILADIKIENSQAYRIANNQPISSDESNECILNILRRHLCDSVDIQEVDVDSDDFLVDFFGQAGYEAIRDAEQVI